MSEQITKEDLEKSLDGLDFLQKSLEASEKGELLTKSAEGDAGEDLSKSGDEDEAEAEAEAEEEGAEGAEEDEEAEKSLANAENELVKSFQENGDLKKAIDVSDFLKSLVNQTTDSIGSMDERLNKSFGAMFDMNIKQNDIIKSLGDQVIELSKSLGELRGVPAGAPRSVGISPVGRNEGDLAKSGASDNINPQELRKSILNRMTMAVEAGELDSLAVVKFDATGEVSEENKARFLGTK